MRVTFLGTNGWYDTKTGNTTCILVETAKEYIIFDAGNGLHKIDRCMSSPKPSYLFISHLHLDHIIGLHILSRFNFPNGLTIVVPIALKNYLQKFMSSPYTIAFDKLSFKTKLIGFDKNINVPLKIKSYKLNHPSPCWGYRLESAGEIVAYGPDTGICDNLYLLAKNADLYISECSYRPGETHQGWTHLNPQEAAGVAKTAGVKKLALVHFDASRYLTLAARKNAQKSAREIFKNTFAATDDQVINV